MVRDQIWGYRSRLFTLVNSVGDLVRFQARNRNSIRVGIRNYSVLMFVCSPEYLIDGYVRMRE